MKKLMYLLPVAALALASCSNNDDPVQAPELAKANVDAAALQIFPVVNATTRISPTNLWTDANFSAFKLTTSGQFLDAPSGNVIDIINKNVSKATGSWVIDGADTYYWPSKTATSDFTAFTRASGEYTASTTSADQEDIMVAYAPAKTAAEYANGVPLNFKHILSQVVFKADNANMDKVTIKVAGIRINNVNSKGSFTLPTADAASAWSAISTPDTYKGFDATNPVTLTASAQTLSVIDPQMLIPQALAAADLTAGTGSYLSVLVNVRTVADGTHPNGVAVYPKVQAEGDTAAAPDQSGDNGYAWAAVDFGAITWEAGKKYIYTLHFTENGLGKVDPDQGDPTTDPVPGTENPTDPTPDNPTDDQPDEPGPGEDIVDNPIPLVLTVTVTDWEEVEGSYDL